MKRKQKIKVKKSIEDAIKNEGFVANNLVLDDYHWELIGGGENDPSIVNWNESLGSSVRFSDLQQFQVVFLPALRDVRNDLRNSRLSPVRKICG